MPEGLVQLLVVTGAAGAFFWVLRWIVDGKLHTKSEVDGLKADKRELFAANKILAEANARTNEALKEIIDLLREPEDFDP